MNIQDLIANFSIIDEWEDRYSYIIDLGRELSPFENSKKNDEYRIYGCSSSVWWSYRVDDNGIYTFAFDSDALIVKGLLYIVGVIFNGKNKEEIKNTNITEIFAELGLNSHLSSQRLMGLAAVVEKVQNGTK